MNPKPKAYSFIRFLRSEQAGDDSDKRQLEESRHYARSKGFILDESLTMEEEGSGPFSGEEKSKGALGAFLEAVINGRVPSGSLLIIERLDLLSREETISAMSLFSRIIDKGVTIVTLADGIEYNRDTINTNVVHISRQIIGMLW